MDEQQMQAGAPAPSPDDVMGKMEDERMAQIEAIAASAPSAERPYDAKLLKKLADAINKLIDQIDPDMAEVEYDGSGKIDGQFPAEVYIPLVLIMSFVQQMGPDFAKYMMDPAELVNDAAVRKAIAMVQRIAKDKDLMKRMKEPAEMEAEPQEPQAEKPEAEMKVAPDQMDDDDQAIMEAM
tara:strand:+ start:372 stop:914 length:543 start_codon:yes stop_codon:yes gene_type:complete